jgi:hypothetical protein
VSAAKRPRRSASPKSRPAARNATVSCSLERGGCRRLLAKTRGTSAEAVGSFDGDWLLSEERGFYDCGHGEVALELGLEPVTIRLKRLSDTELQLAELDLLDHSVERCTLSYDVSGLSATLAGPQTCSYTDPAFSMTWTEDALTLEGDSLRDRGKWQNDTNCRANVDSTYTRR